MMGRSGERGSGISVLAAQHDDDESVGGPYNVTSNRQLDYSTTAILLLIAAYISSVCVLYGHICITRMCACKQASDVTSLKRPRITFPATKHTYV